MTTMASPVSTTLLARPGYEGANIRTWIGFKHFIYLVEESVLAWLREHGAGARELFHQHGLGVEIVDCSVQLPAVLEVDDEVRAEVGHLTGRRFTVQLTVRRDGRDVVVLRGKVTVALVAEAGAMLREPVPAALAGFAVGDLSEATGPVEPRAELPSGPSSALWSWRAPYFYCHFSDRVQHSGFVRCLEESVDRFLAGRGISVGRMLRERSWIPVVSRARVRMLAPAHTEETVHTVFTVTDVLRGIMFDGRMDCFVERDGAFVPVATATILHGYAISRGPLAGTLAELDPGVCAVLLGTGR